MRSSGGTEQFFSTVKVFLPKSFSFSKTSVTFVEEEISTILGLGESRLEFFTSHDSLGYYFLLLYERFLLSPL